MRSPLRAALVANRKAGQASENPPMRGFHGTLVVSPGTVNATTTKNVTLTIPQLLVGDVLTLNPPAAIEADIMASPPVVTANKTAVLRLLNWTGANIVMAARTWSYTIHRSGHL